MTIVEKLNRTRLQVRRASAVSVLVNPDGPEAADALQSQSARIAELRDALTTIGGQAICYGMKADDNELRDWLRFISETAEASLTKDSTSG